jgi:hypothetical protein
MPKPLVTRLDSKAEYDRQISELVQEAVTAYENEWIPNIAKLNAEVNNNEGRNAIPIIRNLERIAENKISDPIARASILVKYNDLTEKDLSPRTVSLLRKGENIQGGVYNKLSQMMMDFELDEADEF